MTSPLPLERTLLSQAEAALGRGMPARPASAERRTQVVEAAAARLGGFDLHDYHRAFGTETLGGAALDDAASALLDAIRRTCIGPALALSILAREVVGEHERRSTGAHHTDFRLAALIGRRLAGAAGDRLPLVDPASGAGILLVASVQALCGQDRKAVARRLAEGVVAADTSVAALRGARMSLASLTGDLGAIKAMAARWHAGDSLARTAAEWRDALGSTSALVVGNPPWEKLKVHRHEEERAAGGTRHYGAAHDAAAPAATERRKAEVRRYAVAMSKRFDLASGELDLFAGFTQLMIELAGDEGAISALLPAGLIRSKSTRALRERLFEAFGQVDLAVFDNKARFFEIDSRFKFLAVTASGAADGPPSARSVRLSRGSGSDDRADGGEATAIRLSSIRSLRPDLSIPEVADAGQWRLFARMSEAGQRWTEPGDPWAPVFSREVDMTRERRHFRDRPGDDAVPLVEGRMVHQHRFGAKAYRTGTGRRAIWSSAPIGRATVEPQFWIAPRDVPASTRLRLSVERAGFCDIAGQTNERSMLAAVVPAGVVCGNKVPTVLFPNAPGSDALHLWCGMVNSLAFDWLLRRVLTTTVNYFLLQSVPLPPIAPGSLPGRRIADAARSIAALDIAGGWEATDPVAVARREIDLSCLRAYGVREAGDVATILDDFPSLDRGQPPLPGERRSTITRDFVLSAVDGPHRRGHQARSRAAMALGARPYVPSQVDGEDGEASQRIRAAP